MPPRNVSANAGNKGTELTNPTTPGYSEGGGGGGGGGGSSSGSSFSGIDNPEALAILMDFIKQSTSGGTADQKKQRADRDAQIKSARGTLGDYSKQAAFGDAADLMAQQLRKSLEANMPAISRSIQGAGTSASSMQGLLSQKLATESAQAASALGAEQAKAYGGISAQLQGVLEALTRIDPSIETNLLKALDMTKVSRQTQSSVTAPTAPTNSTSSRTASGGGSFLQAPEQQQSFGMRAGPSNGVPSSPGAPTSYTDWGFGVVPGESYNPNITDRVPLNTFDYQPAYEPLVLDVTGDFGDADWGYGD